MRCTSTSSSSSDAWQGCVNNSKSRQCPIVASSLPHGCCDKGYALYQLDTLLKKRESKAGLKGSMKPSTGGKSSSAIVRRQRSLLILTLCCEVNVDQRIRSEDSLVNPTTKQREATLATKSLKNSSHRACLGTLCCVRDTSCELPMQRLAPLIHSISVP